jgi:exodeoxyribonuclease V gamma subunit
MLQKQLVEQSTGGGRIGRGVTFSSLKPMRSIPFKVIGMIGMNEGVFPAAKIPIEFDLMNLEPEPGDPIQLEEDRYLFLENLLSARENLYFSYVGQSNREDTHFPPSVVLREFMDYLEEHYGLKSKDILTKHRMQAFSPAYFKENDLFSYSETQQQVAQQLTEDRSISSGFMKKNLPPPGEEWKRLSVNNLISFFQHPARYLFQNRLGIYLRENDVLTEDREPFGMNGLDGYWVGQELLDRYIKDKPLDSYQQILESRNMLPEGWSGEQAFNQKVKEVREFGSDITAELDREPLQDCEVDIAINEFRVVGKLSGIYDSAQITYRFGKMRPKDLIDLWIRHLLFQLAKPDEHSGFSVLFTKDKKTPFARYQLSPLDNARAILEQLLATYWDGLQQCIYFFQKTSFAYGREVIFKGNDKQSGLKKASYEWDPHYGDYDGEVEDPYNRLILGNKNPLQTEEFPQRSIEFWTPFFNVLNQGDPV